MTALEAQQIDQFWRDGVLVVEDAVLDSQLDRLRQQFDAWVEESRGHDLPYGEMIDGRPRFDVEQGHKPDAPALRRVNAPADISDAYLEAVRDSRMTEMVADLIGPNVKHHHNKINSKLPGTRTEVRWHQDFPFTPHTNTDLVTALLMLDDMTPENGPLQIAPGSHRGPIMSLWQEGRFTGAIDEAEMDRLKPMATTCTGKAGSVCLMHTLVAHGSTANASSRPRTLLITVYSAADAAPCSPNPVAQPS